jgi:hypothetical protein
MNAPDLCRDWHALYVPNDRGDDVTIEHSVVNVWEQHKGLAGQYLAAEQSVVVTFQPDMFNGSNLNISYATLAEYVVG